jgi:hypothetical protein
MNKKQLAKYSEFIKEFEVLPNGIIKTPTSTVDINGKRIYLGDIVDYDFKEDDPSPFKVVFEHNAFRKKYKDWDDTLVKPILEFGVEAKEMRLIKVSDDKNDVWSRKCDKCKKNFHDWMGPFDKPTTCINCVVDVQGLPNPIEGDIDDLRHG